MYKMFVISCLFIVLLDIAIWILGFSVRDVLVVFNETRIMKVTCTNEFYIFIKNIEEQDREDTRTSAIDSLQTCLGSTVDETLITTRYDFKKNTGTKYCCIDHCSESG